MSVDISDDWKLKTTPVVKLKIPDEMFVPCFFYAWCYSFSRRSCASSFSLFSRRHLVAPVRCHGDTKMAE